MKTLKRFSALALALMLAFTLFACDSGDENSLGSSTPEEAVVNYYKSFEEKNIQAFLANTAKAKLTKNGNTEDDAFAILKTSIFEVEHAYGENFSFTVEATKVEYLLTMDLVRIQKEYGDSAELAGMNVTNGADVVFDITIKGDIKEASGVGRARVILENGSWKVYALTIHI